MSVAIPSVPDRDNREPSNREPRDWSADWHYLIDRFGKLLGEMKTRGWTVNEVFEELEPYFGRTKSCE